VVAKTQGEFADSAFMEEMNGSSEVLLPSGGDLRPNVVLAVVRTFEVGKGGNFVGESARSLSRADCKESMSDLVSTNIR